MGNVARTSPRRIAALLIALGMLVPAAMPDSTSAGRHVPQGKGSGPQRGALLVKLKSSAFGAAATSALASAGATEIGRLDEVNTRVVKAPPGLAKKVRERLLANPNVASVEYDGEGHATLLPNDALWSKEWYARKVRGPAAWDLTTGRSGTVIAVLDTGVDANHPDLRGRMVPGWNFDGNNSKTYDNGNHGTPVAGIIAGGGNNGIGIAGMCWKCRIMPVKVLNSAGSGSWSNIAAGIIWATRNGADVINLSLGGATGSTALRDAVKFAVDRGVVVVAAAGNSGTTRLFYPAAYPGVIAVAATTSSDRLYRFSNRGSWVDVAAPGCTWTTAPNRRWREFCGTSAAAPVVSGIAALILSRAPAAPRAAVERALESTAVRIGRAVSAGRVSAFSALRKFGQQTSNAAPDPTPKATPKPTPQPTPKATPTPTPTPGVPRQGEVRWEDELWSDEDTDSRWFSFGRNVRFQLRWESLEDIRVEIDNQSGMRVYTYDDNGWRHEDHSHADFSMWLLPGNYKVTVSGDDDDETAYRIDIEWHD